MSGSLAPKLTEPANVIEGHGRLAQPLVVGIHRPRPTQVEYRPQQHRGVAVREHEAIAVGPDRIRRVEAHDAIPEGVDQRRERHRRTRMPGVGGLDRIHRQRPNGVDGELIELRVGGCGHGRSFRCACALDPGRAWIESHISRGVRHHRRHGFCASAATRRGPPGLVAGAEAGAVVAVEVLIERNAVAPVRVVLELFRAAKHRTPAGLVAQEDALQAIGDLVGHLGERHQRAGAGGTLHAEGVAVVGVELDQRANEEDVHREPHRAAPVGVPTEHPAVRLGRLIRDLVILPSDVHDVWMLLVPPRHRADAVGAQELLFVQHA